MKKSLIVCLLLIIVVLVGVSCRTTPPPEEIPIEELAEATERAQVARQRAIDFESPEYFPDEWEALEAQFEAAGEIEITTADEAREAIEAFNAAADAFDEIFRKTIPLYAQVREDEIMAARSALVATGLTRQYPRFLRNADDIALLAYEQYEAGDYYTARETAAAALSEYTGLLLAARVYLTRQEIIERGFVRHDPDNFANAEELACEALEEFQADNREAAFAMAEEAFLRFNQVLANGWTSYASERRELATQERELAIAERANVASRNLFRDADTVFDQAESNLAAENFHDAAIHFIDAEALFAIARMDTAERRERAEAAIRAAEERIEESEETALEAERIIEGGTR